MIIQSRRVWLYGQFCAAHLEIKDGIIVDVKTGLSPVADKDYGDKRIVPGFIDTHTHGGWDYDTNEDDPDGLRRWARNLPQEGVTSFCPTTVTDDDDVVYTALRNIASVMGEKKNGAEILGINLEGPFLCKEFKGAQPEPYIRKGNIDEFKKFQQAADGNIIAITLAPDEDPEYALTRYCAQSGITVYMGHSNVTFEQAIEAVASGVKGVTHVYNGMGKYVNREPGLLGAAFRLDGLYGEVIADGMFVSLTSAANLYRLKNDSEVVMISDSMKSKGCAPGRYMFGGEPMILGEDGVTRRENGVMVGSTLHINQGLYKMVELASVPFRAAIKSCTINPATILGVDDHKGKLEIGYDADIVVLEDNYDVNTTFCCGEVAFSIDDHS